ncbi:MAG: hypothetical protein ACKOSO_03050, partial [Actinomycetota bacterium]
MEARVALTKRQQEVLEVVEQYTEEHGYPPTVREIGEAIGLASPSTVHARQLDRVRTPRLALPAALAEVDRARLRGVAAQRARLLERLQ